MTKGKAPGDTIGQSEIQRTYGLTRSEIEHHLPQPRIKTVRTRGRWFSQKLWNRKDIEALMQTPPLQELLCRKEEDRLNQLRMEEAQELLSRYNPQSMVEQGRQLRRVFVLHVGPTNSGKTYQSIQALMSAGTGTYLGPLRLLALEMYDRLNGAGIPCSLLTGEESLPVEGARIVSSTIELCDFHRHFQVAVIDEAQLIADPERGAAWFRALCQVDADEVHVCLAPEALDILEQLVQQFGAPYTVVRHERMVPLQYSGRCRGYRDIRPGDAIICFSRKNVLSAAALLERNGFKTSVIYGALPPAARRNEVERYTSGETNVIVATDAIGMGISLPIRRVIFAETHKFDGKERRPLQPGEVKQIAGRAGRFGMFDLGEVLTMDSGDVISQGLAHPTQLLQNLCIAFPRETLSSDLPLSVLLKAWQSLPENPSFRREDVKDAIQLNAMLQINRAEDRELVFDLITCPVDARSRELTGYWLNCARAILRKKSVPEPYFGTRTLADCELQYKAYGIHHQLMLRIGRTDDGAAAAQDAVCRRIRELMEQDKSEYIRKCAQCGKELPMGYPFNYCRSCITRKRQIFCVL